MLYFFLSAVYHLKADWKNCVLKWENQEQKPEGNCFYPNKFCASRMPCKTRSSQPAGLFTDSGPFSATCLLKPNLPCTAQWVKPPQFPLVQRKYSFRFHRLKPFQ